jgi:ElaA protein
MSLTWHDASFARLPAATLYNILGLRSRVFVVEQRCVYNDIDGLDPAAHHLWAEDRGQIVACLRLMPAGLKYAELGIGRVVVAATHRASGLGHELMRRALELAGAVAIKLSAQAHLERFYSEHGFTRVSEVYEDDGIPHVDMLRVVHEQPCA